MLKLRLKYLSMFFALISVLSFFNVVYSYYFNLYLNLNLFLYFDNIVNYFLLFYKIKISKDKPNIFDKILTILFGYVLIPIILSIPFYLSIYNFTFINSFFERYLVLPQLVFLRLIILNILTKSDFMEIIYSMDWWIYFCFHNF